jgi:hypothetical protein
MANSIIEQKPLFNTLPVGQDIIFVVSNDTALATQERVKFIAEVHIADEPPNVSTATDLIATFKTTPNNAGVGIFNFSDVIENYVSADHMAALNTTYKGTTTTASKRHSLHIVDKFSKSNNVVKYLALQFKVEYLGAGTDPNAVTTAAGTSVNSDSYIIFNGYLKRTDILQTGTGTTQDDFGFDLFDYEPIAVFPTTNTRKFLTNAPTQLYANIGDYGTLSFLQSNSTLASAVNKVRFEYFDSDGSSLGNEEITKDFSNGAYDNWSAETKKLIVHLGCFPANLRNHSTTFQALVTADTIQGGYYTIELRNAGSFPVTQKYTVNVTCPDLRGYESYRLCWLNQWGAWDYYTFTKKSTKTINSQQSTYQQLEGSWNERAYRLDSFRGGKKTFRRNATEQIRINTDYISANENVLFEEMINSPEIYLLDSFQTDTNNSLLNQYVTPIRLLTSSFTEKTVANDKLIQYTFEIEKSLTLRTQSI